MARLDKPSTCLEESYQAFVREFLAAGEDIFGLTAVTEVGFAEHVRRLDEYTRAVNLREGFVPASRFWLVGEDEEILGEVDVRRRLTPALEDFGGHIGSRRVIEKNEGRLASQSVAYNDRLTARYWIE